MSACIRVCPFTRAWAFDIGTTGFIGMNAMVGATRARSNEHFIVWECLKLEGSSVLNEKGREGGKRMLTKAEEAGKHHSHLEGPDRTNKTDMYVSYSCRLYEFVALVSMCGSVYTERGR